MFAYCNNNPTNKKDPSGELGILALCTIGAIAGASIDYAAQVISNYRTGLSGSSAWTSVNVGSIAGSAFSGAVSAVPGGSLGAAIVDSVGSALIEISVNSLLAGDEINIREIGNEAVKNLAIDMLTPDFVEVSIPKYIRDIKKEAIQQGIKGTRKLQKYLDFKQVSGILINSFNSDSVSRLVDYAIAN